MPSFSSAQLTIDPPDIDETTELVEKIKALRFDMDLTQRDFADRFGLSLNTFRHWEKQRRVPEGPALLLLEMILLDPEGIHRMINRIKAKRNRRRLSLVES